ncbi:unnamed protein product, partial [marine sediment metagenome]
MYFDYKWVYLPPYNESEVARRPEIAGHYGEMPEAFIVAIKEKTGFEGYELQDYIDLLMVDLFTGWDLAGWIDLQYQIQADRRAKFSRFKTFLFTVMAACIAIPVIVTAITAATAAVTTSTSMALSTFGKIKL